MFQKASVSHSVGEIENSHPPADMPPPCYWHLVTATIQMVGMWTVRILLESFLVKKGVFCPSGPKVSYIDIKTFKKNIFCGLNYHHISVFCSIGCFDRLHVQVTTLSHLFSILLHGWKKTLKQLVTDACYVALSCSYLLQMLHVFFPAIIKRKMESSRAKGNRGKLHWGFTGAFLLQVGNA